ncbi:hypothetical protein EMMF5_005042 [Cystobasidiomycetes sp. EMM_F5]
MKLKATGSKAALLGAAAAMLAAVGVQAQALAEPPAGQFVFGIWAQSDPGYQETPAQLNIRGNFNFPIFEMGQPIPVPRYNFTTGVGGPIPEAYIAATGTDADIFLTVYPRNGLSNVTDSDILSLGLQIRTYQGSGRTVFLRWGPEMNGNWMVYGLQPTAFKSLWIRMYTIIKSEAPDTVIVWSPNTGYSYPFGASLSSVASAADRRALDTNNDGQLTSADDPYSPFYPGDQYVDWNGYSMYYKGPDFANINQNQVRGYFYDVIHGISPYASQGNTVDWYQTYCAQKPTKACVISEAGAAYHTSPNLMRSQVNTQLQIQQTWWRDGPLNQTLLSTHPRLKMYIQFEFIKNETDGGVLDERDYRILNNSAVNAAFQSDLSSYATRYVTANMTTSAAPNSTAFHLTPSGPVVTATVTPAGGSAITATYTQFYSGPFANYSYVATRDPLANPTGTSTLTGVPTAPAAAGGIGAAGNGQNTAPSLYGNNAASPGSSVVGTVTLSIMTVAAALFGGFTLISWVV